MKRALSFMSILWLCNCNWAKNESKMVPETLDPKNEILMLVQDGIMSVTARMAPKNARPLCACHREFRNKAMELYCACRTDDMQSVKFEDDVKQAATTSMYNPSQW